MSLGVYSDQVIEALSRGDVKAHEIQVSQEFDESRSKPTGVAKEQFDDPASSLHSPEQKNR
jgi:hypothetical protein